MHSEALLKYRFGEHYAQRLIQAYKGEESIGVLAKEFGVTRSAISANIIRYLGHKKRYKKHKKPLLEDFFNNKIKVYPSLKQKILLLKSVLSEFGVVKRKNRKTVFIIDDTIVFYFKFISKPRTENIIPVSVYYNQPEGHYIIVSPKGISIQFLKKGYNSVREFINSFTDLRNKFSRDFGINSNKTKISNNTVIVNYKNKEKIV